MLAAVLVGLVLRHPEIGKKAPGSHPVVATLAILGTAVLAGTGPGLLATAVIIGVTLEPNFAPWRVARLVLFVVGGVTISVLGGALRAARRRAEEAGAAIRRSEERLRAILDNSPAAIFLKDTAGRYLLVNRQYERLLGLAPGEALGKTDHDVLPAEVADALRDHDRQVLETGEAHEWEEVLPQADGPHTFVAQKFPLRGPAGAPYAVGGIATDITDRKRIERELQRAKDEAEAAGRARDQFLAMLSHELRTPLTPVLLAATGLCDDPAAPPELSETLGLIRRNVELEARLIDDLLDVVRITRGKLLLRPEAVDAHALIRQAVEICRDDIESAGLRLELGLSAARHHVFADPARLEQVFWNLIKNAVKFSPPGGSLAVRSRDGEGSTLVVEVSDTGVGIDPALLPRIFDPFEQGDAPPARRLGGLGLGLAICRAVVEAHGGRIEAASAGRDRGATFTVELATVAAPTPAPTPSAPAPAPPASEHRSLLLVEDHEDTLRVLSRLLTRHGYRVTTATSLAAARQAATADGFDLLVCDLHLPDGNGLDLIRQLAARGPIQGIALSGYGTDRDLQASRDAGFRAHLTKPVDFPTLLETLRELHSGAE
jgi:PAS domain S-box-containing protein